MTHDNPAVVVDAAGLPLSVNDAVTFTAEEHPGDHPATVNHLEPGMRCVYVIPTEAVGPHPAGKVWYVPGADVRLVDPANAPLRDSAGHPLDRADAVTHGNFTGLVLDVDPDARTAYVVFEPTKAELAAAKAAGRGVASIPVDIPACLLTRTTTKEESRHVLP